MPITAHDLERIERGIAGYSYHRKLLRRLLRRGFNQDQFDQWFGFERAKIYPTALSGDSFILGRCDTWSEMLRILQYMVVLGEADAKSNPNGKVEYRAMNQCQ